MYLLMTQTTLRAYKDYGCPFWDSTQEEIHLIQNLSDLICWGRYYMEDDKYDYVGIYKDDQLIGGWQQETDWEYDGEIGHYCVGLAYCRLKPGSFEWKQLHKNTHRIAFK